MPRNGTSGFALILLVLLSAGTPATGQTSVGFRDPDNIQPILDYRLPSWGYTETSVW